MARVLFAGFGDLGREAGCLLRESGLRVVALKRTPPADLLPGVEYHALDLRQPYALPATLRGHVDVAVIAVSPPHHDRHEYRATYVGAVEHTLRALAAAHAKPKRVIFVSSTSVWADCADRVITEDDPPTPDSWSGEVMVQAEQSLFAGPFPATTLRLAGIYGPGRYMMLRKAQAIIDGREPMPTPSWTNRIHRDDAARLLVFLVQRAVAGDSLERVYIGVDDTPSLNVDVLAYLHGQLQGREPEERPPSGRPIGGKRVGNARVRALGFRFRYPDFRSGYVGLVRAWREGH